MSTNEGGPVVRSLESISRWVLTHRGVVIVGAVLWVVVSSVGLGWLGFKNDYRMFFSKENPELLAFESLQRTFTKADNILIAITPRNGALTSREHLAAIEALTSRSWQLPGATRVDSITNFQDSFADGDEIVVQDMVRRAATLSDEQIARIRQRILAEPLLVGRLVDRAGTVTGINVMFEFDDQDKDAAVVRAGNAAHQLAAEARTAYPDLEFHLTGGVMLDAAFTDSAERDIRFLTPIMLAVSIGLIGYFLGSFWATLVTTAVISGSILCALGWAGYLGIALSPSSLGAPTILMTMAVADSVHFLTGYYGRLETSGDRIEAMVHSMVSHLPAVFFTSAATVVSFLTLNFSDAPPFRDLGNITAMGVAAAFVLSLTLLPAMITFVPVGHARRRFEGLKRFLETVFALIEKAPRTIATVGVTTCLILTALAFLNRLDDRYVEYFGESLTFRQDTDYVDRNLTGIYSIEYPLKARGEDGINDPAFLGEVEAFSEWLRTQPEVTHVFSIVDIIKKLNMNMNGDNPASYRIPDSRKLAAQYLLTYELSLPQGVNLVDRVDVNRSAIRLTAALRNVSSQQAIDLEARAQTWMTQHMPADMRVAGTGATLMFAHIGQRNILAMITGEVMGMTLVSLLMILYLRSFSLGVLSMIPNLLPAGVAIGIWYVTVGEIGLTSSVVAAMTLGILTDDTVHFLEKYAHYHRSLSARDALARAFREAGPAIWITSLVLMSGFAVLALSSFRLNGDLGILTVIILALGLVGDFILLPAVVLSLQLVRKAVWSPARAVSMRESS
jgi:predicted RND superfamily exporter protein